MVLPPEMISILTAVVSIVGGGIAGWVMAGRKATLERANQAALAETNYAHSRNLQELAHYVTRKHRVVPELHKRLVEAKSRILSLGRNLLRPRLERANLEDVRRYMEQQEVLRGVQEEVVALWETDRSAAAGKLNEWLTIFEGEKARRSLVRARNFVLEYELYISAPTFRRVQELLRLLELQLWQSSPPKGLLLGVPPAPNLDEIRALHEDVTAQLRNEIGAVTEEIEGASPGKVLAPRSQNLAHSQGTDHEGNS